MSKEKEIKEVEEPFVTRTEVKELIEQEIGSFAVMVKNGFDEIKLCIRESAHELRKEFRQDMNALRNELRSEIKAESFALRSEITGLRQEMNQRFDEMNHRIDVLSLNKVSVEQHLILERRVTVVKNTLSVAAT